MFAQKINNDIFFIRMHREDTFFWHYVAVNKNKIPLLEKVSTDTELDVNDIGRVLDSGWGFYPPKVIEEKYIPNN